MLSWFNGAWFAVTQAMQRQLWAYFSFYSPYDKGEAESQEVAWQQYDNDDDMLMTTTAIAIFISVMEITKETQLQAYWCSKIGGIFWLLL